MFCHSGGNLSNDRFHSLVCFLVRENCHPYGVNKGPYSGWPIPGTTVGSGGSGLSYERI